MDFNIYLQEVTKPMRSLFVIILGTLLIASTLAGCGLFSKTEAPPLASAPISTATPTKAPNSWSIVQTLDIDSDIFFAGFHQENLGIAVGYGGKVLYTHDGSDNWLRGENNSACRFGLDIVDENIAWHIGNGGNVAISKDGGQIWQRVADLSDSGVSKSIRFLDEQTGWAASEKELWATSDGGQTWIDVPLPDSGITILAIELLSESNGLILASPGVLYATHNGGETWTSISLGPGQDQISILALPSMRFFDKQNGTIAAKFGGKGIVVLQTTDGGETWEQENISVELSTSNPGLYLSSDGRTLTIRDSRIIVLRRSE
jgi:photosystem II stability/assembly factor-like uncharacterized protein